MFIKIDEHDYINSKLITNICYDYDNDHHKILFYLADGNYPEICYNSKEEAILELEKYIDMFNNKTSYAKNAYT